MDDTSRPVRSKVVTAIGDLDMDTIGPVAQALHAAAEAYDVVILDASGITFADSSFLNLLLSVHRETLFRIAAPQEQLMRLLEMTGADGVLTLVPTVAGATEAA
ncbi:STAS domain-containing protein [Streptomyces sp. NPDC088748]|uniref:STAS domain-containing protein n=1 Tax=Streptomyces sp. NPDC088748 TaxID=3365887 RepID=UPI00381C9134